MEKSKIIETWMKHNNYSWFDVLADDDGDYVLIMDESDHSDDYEVDFRKFYLSELLVGVTI